MSPIIPPSMKLIRPKRHIYAMQVLYLWPINYKLVSLLIRWFYDVSLAHLLTLYVFYPFQRSRKPCHIDVVYGRASDGWMDGRTDGQTDGRTEVGTQCNAMSALAITGGKQKGRRRRQRAKLRPIIYRRHTLEVAAFMTQIRESGAHGHSGSDY